jgi:GTP-binding protein
VALRVTETTSADVFEVAGRGQLHLTVLIEAMRREGFEMLIGPPTVITTEIGGKLCEPFESVEIQVPEEHLGVVMEMLSKRKGEIKTTRQLSDGRSEVIAVVPTRGLVGMRGALLTGTRGTAMMDSAFLCYKPFVGTIDSREKGSLLAYESGTATAYGLMHAQERGQLFVQPRTEVYKDMIVGINRRPGDLAVNVCKLKQLTNMRSATKGEGDATLTCVAGFWDTKAGFTCDGCARLWRNRSDGDAGRHG